MRSWLIRVEAMFNFGIICESSQNHGELRKICISAAPTRHYRVSEAIPTANGTEFATEYTRKNERGRPQSARQDTDNASPPDTTKRAL